MSGRQLMHFRRWWLWLFGAAVLPGLGSAQGYGVERPWGRLPYHSVPQQVEKQPERYNPWTQMREAERLPPPAYRGEADENAPEYPDEPDPTYRELPRTREVLSDPRAYGSPWTEHRRVMPDYGYAPAYPATGLPAAPRPAPYGGFYGPYSPFSSRQWGGPAFGW